MQGGEYSPGRQLEHRAVSVRTSKKGCAVEVAISAQRQTGHRVRAIRASAEGIWIGKCATWTHAEESSDARHAALNSSAMEIAVGSLEQARVRICADVAAKE